MKEVAIALGPPSNLEVFQRQGLLTIDFSFTVFIFHSDVIPDEISVLQGCLIENLQLLSVSGSSPEDPRGYGPDNREILFPLTPDLSRKKGRVLLAVGRSHHSLMTRLLWCPPPSLMACQSPMVASQLVVSRGSRAMFAGRGLTFIQSLGQED